MVVGETPVTEPVTADEFLREAATLLRERAEAATPGPWARGDPSTVENTRASCVIDGDGGMPCSDEDAAHIAMMHPGVALALADWLDEVAAAAQIMTHQEHQIPGVPFTVPLQVMALAATILGRTWEKETA